MNIFVKADAKILEALDAVVLYCHNQFDISRIMLIRICMVLYLGFWISDLLFVTNKIDPLSLGIIGFVIFVYLIYSHQDRQRTPQQKNHGAYIRRTTQAGLGRVITYGIFFMEIPVIINRHTNPIFQILEMIFWILYLLGWDTFTPEDPPKRKEKLVLAKVAT